MNLLFNYEISIVTYQNLLKAALFSDKFDIELEVYPITKVELSASFRLSQGHAFNVTNLLGRAEIAEIKKAYMDKLLERYPEGKKLMGWRIKPKSQLLDSFDLPLELLSDPTFDPKSFVELLEEYFSALTRVLSHGQWIRKFHNQAISPFIDSLSNPFENVGFDFTKWLKFPVNEKYDFSEMLNLKSIEINIDEQHQDYWDAFREALVRAIQQLDSL